MNELRIFIGLREIAGYYGALKKGFDELGVEALFVNLGGNPFHYGEAQGSKPPGLLARAYESLNSASHRNPVLRVFWILFVQTISGVFLLPWAAMKFNVFIFGSNSSFLFFLDLPVLKLLGKKIIYVFNGSDSRPVYLNGYVMTGEKRGAILRGMLLTRLQKITVAIIDRYAHVVINIPPQAHFHSRSFVSGFIIGLPRPAELPIDLPPVSRRAVPGVTRILHAPSKPGPKGSVSIREVIQRLRDRGHSLEFVEIIGRPNSEVLTEIMNCDFVIDELYSDTPMATFAAEAAFFGKPAIVGGYYAASICHDVAPEDMPPSLFVTPDCLEEGILRMISDQEFREALGKRAQGFITEKWVAKQVARRFIRLIEGDIPREWVYDPYAIRYVHGCGFSEESARRSIKGFVLMGGKGSLCMSDKPELEKRLIDFAFLGTGS